MGFLFSKPKPQPLPQLGSLNQVIESTPFKGVYPSFFDYDGILTPEQYKSLLRNTLQPNLTTSETFFYSLPIVGKKSELPKRPTVRINTAGRLGPTAAFWENRRWNVTGTHSQLDTINPVIYDGDYANLPALALALQGLGQRRWADAETSGF